MKQFSNRYMLFYALGLAAVVAIVLTVVSVSLKPRQTRNQEAESKQMILKTIGIEATLDNADALFEAAVKPCDDYYTFDGGVIIPLKGNGLWGPIWGYLALDSNMTVVGAIFDHQGETPGLGGEIATDKFAKRFVGKKMDSQAIRLTKHADPANPYEVDALSGSTMTSNGVTEMLFKAFEQYSHNRKEATE